MPLTWIRLYTFIHFRACFENSFSAKKAGVVFVDLTAAYDTVWHCGLTCKLVQLLPNGHLVRTIMEMVGNGSLQDARLATFPHERLEWSLVDKTPEQSEAEWLCVDFAGYKIINIYKPPRSRLTPTAIPTFPHPILYVSDFSCQHVNWGYNKTPLTARAGTPRQHPTTLDWCIT